MNDLGNDHIYEIDSDKNQSAQINSAFITSNKHEMTQKEISCYENQWRMIKYILGDCSNLEADQHSQVNNNPDRTSACEVLRKEI